MLILDLSCASVIRHGLQFVGSHLVRYSRVVHIQCTVLSYLLDSDLLGGAISIEEVVYCSCLWGDSPVDSIGRFLLPAFVDGIDRVVHCLVGTRCLLCTDNIIDTGKAHYPCLFISHNKVLAGLVGIDASILIHDKVAILNMHIDFIPFRASECSSTECSVLVLT